MAPRRRRIRTLEKAQTADPAPLVNDEEYRSILDAWPSERRAARTYWNSLPVEQMLEHFIIFEVDKDAGPYSMVTDVLIEKILQKKREAEEHHVRVHDLLNLKTMVPRVYNALCMLYDSDGDVERLRDMINDDVGEKRATVPNDDHPRFTYEELENMSRQALRDVAVDNWNMDPDLISGMTDSEPRKSQLIQAIWRAQTDPQYVQDMQIDDEEPDEIDLGDLTLEELRRRPRQELLAWLTDNGIALRAGTTYTKLMLAEIILDAIEDIEADDEDDEDDEDIGY